MSIGYNVNISITNNDGNTLYVGGSGPGNYSKIQDAIDNASHGDTVFVYNGTYYENVDIGISINLTGEDKNNTIIDGLHERNAIELRADFVKIKSFTIYNNLVGINIYSNQSLISDNILQHNHWGIFIHEGIHNNTIIDNKFFSNQYTIETRYTNNITISRNMFIDNHFAIRCYMYDNNNVVSENIFKLNYYGSITFGYGENNIITDNIIEDSEEIGIALFYSNSNIITGNLIGNNELGIFLYYSNNNHIYHNNLVNNTFQAEDERGRNTWDNGYPSGGNYWDDYNGTDSDGDGIGDTPYPIPGGDNEDRYPLMEPWIIKRPIAQFTYSNNTSLVCFDGSSSYDPDGEIISYQWDFGDGTTGNGEITYHKYCDIGTYDVTLTVTDDTGLKDDITKSIKVTLPNIPPSIPEIYGPNSGTTGVEYEYVFIVTDPDGDEFYLFVEWGDGTASGWIGPYFSGEPVILSHEWYDSGTYVIKAKLKDFCDESPWGILEVTMPRDKAINRPFLNFLQSHPNMFPILQLLLQRLGLQ